MGNCIANKKRDSRLTSSRLFNEKLIENGGGLDSIEPTSFPTVRQYQDAQLVVSYIMTERGITPVYMMSTGGVTRRI